MADAPRLFLITPPIEDADAFAPLLARALATADVASLLIRTAARDEHAIKTVARALAPIAQARDVAVLIEHDPRLAARLDVDGVQVAGIGETFEAALESLRPRKIVGVGRLGGRDAAMAAGERGADYLMFGAPRGPERQETESHETICEQVAWWAEIFNVPCVGYAHHPELASDIAGAGGEFIGLCDGLWEAPDIVDALRHVQDSIMPLDVR